MVDLCTLDDVKHEGNLTDAQMTALQENIEYKITDLSDEINTKKKDDADEDDLRRCCVFGVLWWLERVKAIQTTKEIISQTEGDTSQMYAASNKEGRTTSSYEDQFYKYWGRIMKIPAVGACVGLNATYNTYGDYGW